MYRTKCFCNSKYTYLWRRGFNELCEQWKQCFKSFYEQP